MFIPELVWPGDHVNGGLVELRLKPVISPMQVHAQRAPHTILWVPSYHGQEGNNYS